MPTTIYFLLPVFITSLIVACLFGIKEIRRLYKEQPAQEEKKAAAKGEMNYSEIANMLLNIEKSLNRVEASNEASVMKLSGEVGETSKRLNSLEKALEGLVKSSFRSQTPESTYGESHGLRAYPKGKHYTMPDIISSGFVSDSLHSYHRKSDTRLLFLMRAALLNPYNLSYNDLDINIHYPGISLTSKGITSTVKYLDPTPEKLAEEDEEEFEKETN